MGDKDTEWIDKTDSEDFIYQGVLAKRRTTLRHKARELRLSSGSSQQEHGTDLRVLVSMCIHIHLLFLSLFLLHNCVCSQESLIEGFTVEKERVRLWNEYVMSTEFKFPFMSCFFVSLGSGFFFYRRMVGKELKGMSFHELMMFKIEIQTGLGKVKDEMLRSTQQARYV